MTAQESGRISPSTNDVLIFVYGTLRKDEHNHHYVERAVCLAEECWTYGKLYDTGLGYPVLVEEDTQQHRVIGELYCVPHDHLPAIDELEDYEEGRSDNLYIRKQKDVYLKEQSIPCYVYVNAGLPIVESLRIHSGDWKSYRLNLQSCYPLRFQQAWDRGVSYQDRILFTTLNFKYPGESGRISFFPVRTGVTHEGNLFATVIIQNRTSEPCIFENTWVAYKQEGQVIASHPFTIPDLVVKPRTSTPWTFLFPPDTIKNGSGILKQDSVQNWNITFKEGKYVRERAPL